MLLPVLLCSCTKDEVVKLEVSKSEIAFENGGGAEPIAISTNSSWSISGANYWCSATRCSGKGNADVNITADKNGSTSTRTAVFKIKAGGVEKVISVTQTPATLDVSTSSLEISCEGGEKSFTISSNSRWSLDESPDWCSVNPKSGSGNSSILLTFTKNEGLKDRVGNIKVNAGIVKNIAIVQKGNPNGLELLNTIPLGGNAYVTNEQQGVTINEKGICNWTSSSPVVSAYFKVANSGRLDLGLSGNVAAGVSVLEVSVAGSTFNVTVDNTEKKVIPIGHVDIATPGYIRVDLKGKSKTGNYYADLSDLLVGNAAAKGPLNYVNATWSGSSSFYWGRRGPSVHMSYSLPSGDQEYFYNEVTVPSGQDIVGSYYMANGFGEGYFGIQVNSETERRVLFSVWSPFETQDPNNIPENQKIVLVKKGADVKTGEFGNEGSGGQSYLIFPWKAGVTYKFLTRIKPTGKDSFNQDCTEYSSYMYDPESGKWMLIATWRRPITNKYYSSPYSFLENFNPDQGYLSRRVLFGNQWSLGADGIWREIVNGKFTCDNTGSSQVRVDYAGGVDNGAFYLKSFGFFNDNVTPNSSFTRAVKGGNGPLTLQEVATIVAL